MGKEEIMNTFEINQVTYNAQPFDFNLLCDFEEMGVSVADMGKKTMTTARTYFALCCGGDKEFAGNQLQEHLIKGGNLDGLIGAMLKEMQTSDFFQTMVNMNSSEKDAPKKVTKAKAVQ